MSCSGRRVASVEPTGLAPWSARARGWHPQRAGRWPPVAPGEWRGWGLFRADDADQLEMVLASMPLRVWRHDSVTPLSPHPSDPGPAAG